MDEPEAVKDILILEPFYGGSHKQLVDIIVRYLTDENTGTFDLLTLPPKKWHWKARCSALQFSELIPENTKYKSLLCSSDLCLSELLGIRPDLHACHKVVYFHENQLVYPVQKSEALDFQFGYNQILTALSADDVCFNSGYNMQTFLGNINSFLGSIPGYKPKTVSSSVKSKSRILHFPGNFAEMKSNEHQNNTQSDAERAPLHIAWPHRWEFDKDPEAFFKVILQLKEDGYEFKVSVLGQEFTDVPNVFREAKEKLGESHIMQWGYLKNKDEYYTLLRSADVVVSTAIHEFFGVSMMEATYCGCYPLCPNRLSYPELYPKACLYNTDRQLYKRLREFCRKPWLPKNLRNDFNMDFEKFSWKRGKQNFFQILKISKRKREESL